MSMTDLELAAKLFQGGSVSVSSFSGGGGGVTVIYGTARSGDADGSVTVLIDGSSVPASFQTCVHALSGERVALLSNGSSAIVVGVVGCGTCETVITQAEIDIL